MCDPKPAFRHSAAAGRAALVPQRPRPPATGMGGVCHPLRAKAECDFLKCVIRNETTILGVAMPQCPPLSPCFLRNVSQKLSIFDVGMIACLSMLLSLCWRLVRCHLFKEELSC